MNNSLLGKGCPQCQQVGRIQKISSIVRTGTTTFGIDDVRSVDFGKTTIYVPTQHTATITSNLVELFKEPSPPVTPSGLNKNIRIARLVMYQFLIMSGMAIIGGAIGIVLALGHKMFGMFDFRPYRD